MGKRSSYEPGTFSWVDLGTTDPDAARAFYAALFGWSYAELFAGEEGVYTMAMLGGDSVAGLYRRASDGVTAWLSYVTVDDADATASRAKALGGSIVAEPWDVHGAGRMTVVRDPQGGVLACWRPAGEIGAARVNEPGALTWNELATTDPDAAQEFYGALFGWDFSIARSEPVVYRTILNDGAGNGGIVALGSADDQPHWRAYFGADDLSATLAIAREHGGHITVRPVDVAAGRFAAATDPQGAAFYLFEGDFDE